MTPLDFGHSGRLFDGSVGCLSILCSTTAKFGTLNLHWTIRRYPLTVLIIVQVVISNFIKDKVVDSCNYTESILKTFKF